MRNVKIGYRVCGSLYVFMRCFLSKEKTKVAVTALPTGKQLPSPVADPEICPGGGR